MTPTSPAPVALRGMTWDHPRAIDGLHASADLLLERHNVTIDWVSRSLLAFGDQHVADFASEFDVMVIDHPHVPDAVDGGALLALDGPLGADALAILRRESVGRSHDTYNFRGSQWALGLDAAAQVSAFRPDQIDGTPPYWGDVLELARVSRVIWPYKPVDAFSTFATLLAQRGTPLAGVDGFIDRDVTREVLDLMVDLAAHVPDWCADANPIDAAEALSTSDEWSLAVALFGYTNYSRAGFRPHLLSYDDIPSFDGRAGGSTLGGAGIAVSASTPHPQLAVAVAATLAGAEVQAGPYGLGGGQPGNLRAWRSDELNGATANFFRNTLRTLERAWVRPAVLGWPDLQLELSHILHDGLVARGFDGTALDRIEALPTRFLEGASV